MSYNRFINDELLASIANMQAPTSSFQGHNLSFMDVPLSNPMGGTPAPAPANTQGTVGIPNMLNPELAQTQEEIAASRSIFGPGFEQEGGVIGFGNTPHPLTAGQGVMAPKEDDGKADLLKAAFSIFTGGMG